MGTSCTRYILLAVTAVTIFAVSLRARRPKGPDSPERPSTALGSDCRVAGVEDYEVALATYHAAVKRWPGTPITLRQGARVIEDSRRLRLA